MSEVPQDEVATFIEWLPGFVFDARRESELKSYVWMSRREHAVLQLSDGRFVLVRGGEKRILLNLRDGQAVLDIDGVDFPITQLVVHVHPIVTGPSQSDFDVLELLGQDESVLFELNAGRTVFRRKDRPE